MKKKMQKLLTVAMAVACMVFGLAGCGAVGAGSGGDATYSGVATGSDTIKIGLVFSLTGGTAITEECMYNSAVLAIDEINKAGGINGKQVEYIVKDYATDPDTAVKVVREMIQQDNVCAVVGPYISSARIAIEPLMEEYNVPLIYPTFYEGEKPNSYVVYTGCVPNQQGDYFVPYLYENISHNFYLLGTDTTYAQLINSQAEELVNSLGGTVVGNELVSSDVTEFSDIIAKIKSTCGEDGCVIYVNLNGDSGTSFYTQFAAAGLSEKYTIASFIMDESFSTALGSAAANTYASVNYFNSIDTDANKKFLSAYSEKFGADKAKSVTAVGEATYDAVYLLSLSLTKCGDDISTENILKNFDDLSFDAPQGTVKVDSETHHVYCKARIGLVKEDGTIETVFESDDVIKPEPTK